MSGKGKDTVSKLINSHIGGNVGRFLTERADHEADMIYADNFRALAEMSRSSFEWFRTSGEELPSTMSTFHLEKDLFYNGLVVFFRDDVSSTNAFFALPGHGTGNKNMYDEWTRYQIDAPNFRHISRSTDKCVPIWANPTRVPDAVRVARYADALTDLDVTFNVNASNARRTRMIVADENQRVTQQAINDAIDRGDAVVFLKRPLEAKENFTTLDMGVDPKHLIDLHIARQRIWADAMTRLGVDNANQDKKERVNSGEVEANDAQIGAMRQIRLQTRKEACRLINERFSLDLDVRFREMESDSGSGEYSPEDNAEGMEE